MLNAAEAIVRVYHRLGDYQHKHKNRMKFLIKSIGWDRFKAEFESELAQFRAEGGATLPFDPENRRSKDRPTGRGADAAVDRRRRGAGVADRRARAGHRAADLRRSRPPSALDSGAGARPTSGRRSSRGYALVTATIPLGDMSAEQMRVLADLADAYGDGTVRVHAGAGSRRSAG